MLDLICVTLKKDEILLLSSASRRGIKCSNSFSLSAAITSAGWIVFLPSSWVYSFELKQSLLVFERI